MEQRDENWDGRTERRARPRSHTDWQVQAGMWSEHVLPSAELVDVSATGALLAFCQPVGAHSGARVCVSFLTPVGKFHRLGHVVRNARGFDCKSYVAIEFDVDAEDEDDLAALLDEDGEPIAA